MQVRLTESGLNLFGWGAERAITNVHNDRAYHLMVNGHANKDKSFMAMYEKSLPKKAEVKEQPKPQPMPAPKKEKAVSRKATTREKAVKK